MPLEIYLLGQFKITDGTQTIYLPSRPAQSLLSYLAINAGATLRREKLANLLWPDSTESNARAYLRQALWRIRKCLDNSSLPSEDYLQIGDIDITFRQLSDVWVDVAQVLIPAEGLALEEVIAQVSLYQGEFLPGFYDEWVEPERYQIQAAYHQKLERLVNNLVEQERWHDVLKWGEEWIRLGYFTETVYRSVMIAHAGLGSLGMVEFTYQRCKEAIERDLSMDVSPETRHLYEQLHREHRQEKPQPAWQPTGPIKQPSFLMEHHASQIEIPLVVARDLELAQLESMLNLAIKGQGQVIFVTGEVGSGKTTLVAEFARKAQRIHNNLVFASGGCNEHTGIGDPYLPFREILEPLTGDVESRWRVGAITRKEALFLWNLIPTVTQVLVEACPSLLDTFISSTKMYERVRTFANSPSEWKSHFERYLENRRSALTGKNPHQTDLFIQYTKLLQTISRKVPLVLFVDDLQWADLGTISLLFHLGRHLTGSRILILGAYRPEEVSLGREGERHPLKQVINELQLTFGKFEINLDKAGGRPYIDALLDSESNRLSEQFRELLFRQTHGHPLFTIELLRGMRECGDIEKDKEGRWVEGSNLNWENLPARVEAVIAERVGRLDPKLQSILRTASVEGELFIAEVVAQVQNQTSTKIIDDLSNELDRKHRLVSAHSIQQVGGQLLSSYRFRHILVQKYIYGNLDKVEKTHLHEKVGNALENMYEAQPGADSISLQLARHYEQASNIEKAVHYLLQSESRAQLVSASQEAIMHIKKGVALITALPDRNTYVGLELSLLLRLSTALHLAYGLADFEVEQTAIRAYQLCQQVGTSDQMCQILGTLSLYAYIKGEYQTAQNYARKLLELGRESEIPLLEETGHWCMGISSFGMGSLLESRHHLEQIASVYDPKKHHQSYILLQGVDTGSSAMAYLSCCLWLLGYPDQAQAMSAKTLAFANEIGHAFTLADVLRYGCCELHFYRRDSKSLESYANALIRLSQEKEYPEWLAAGKYCLGEAYLLMSCLPEGIELLNEGVRAELTIGVHVSIPGPLCFLAEVYAGLGEVEHGLKVWQESMQLIDQTGERLWEAEHYRVLSMLQQAQGDDLKAESSLKKAIKIARRQSARSWELRSVIALARLLQKQDRISEACHLVQKVLEWFTEGFDTSELKEAVELLTELRGMPG